MDGVLVIDKPAGPTSHDIVQRVKRILMARKVGHLGTLDPAATGVLPLVINEATKRAKELAGKEKIYDFTLRLGAGTDTDDDAGKVTEQSPIPADFLAKLEAVLPSFIGAVMQAPPVFSAVKIGGKRAYKLARGGDITVPESRQVKINSIIILETNGHDVRMRVDCESGTYVRSLCRDLGEAIGTVAHAGGIRRLRSGRFTIDEAVAIEDLEAEKKLYNRGGNMLTTRPL